MVRTCALVAVLVAVLPVSAMAAIAGDAFTSNDYNDFGVAETLVFTPDSTGLYKAVSTVTGVNGPGSCLNSTMTIWTTSDMTNSVTAAWRNRTLFEHDARTYYKEYDPTGNASDLVDRWGNTHPQYLDTANGVALAYDSYSQISDVADLNGLDGITFVLQMDFNIDALICDFPALAHLSKQEFADYMDSIDRIYLGWFVPVESGKADGKLQDGSYSEWVLATEGNSGVGASVTSEMLWYKGSFEDFALEFGVNSSNLDDFLGSFGCDVNGHTVWAILDHNSVFGAIPEPASMTLLALGGLALLRRRNR